MSSFQARVLTVVAIMAGSYVINSVSTSLTGKVIEKLRRL